MNCKLVSMIVPLLAFSINCCFLPRDGQSQCRLREEKYENVYAFKKPGFIDFLKWRVTRLSLNLPDPESHNFPLVPNDPSYLRSNRKDTTITWIGHSTVLIQMGGVNILTDPHFSDRASPFQWIGPKRLTPPGISLDDLPAIDIVLISHDHYDHLDKGSIERLHARPGGKGTVFFVPCGLKEWFENQGIKGIVEMDWGDEYRHNHTRIVCVPMHHWSKRTIFSTNGTLWAGWIAETKGVRLLFLGDTGYSPLYKEIGSTYGPFDLSVLPIGAYEPRWFMKNQHVTPEEALRIHRDIRSRKSVATHWGTFILTDEPLDEPPKRLAQAKEAAGVSDDEFMVLIHGETVIIDGRGNDDEAH